MLQRQFDVVLGLGKGGLFAPLAHHGVGGFVGAGRAGIVGEVWDVEQEVALLGGGILGLHIQGGDLLVDAAHLGLDGGSVLALGLEHADLLGNRFALVLQLLLVGLGVATGFIAGEHGVHEFPMVAATELEAVGDGGGVFADDADVEHGAATFAAMRGRNQPRIFNRPASGERSEFHFAEMDRRALAL